ncbi:hypothetical protein WMF23_00155 [Sorangium sp. So ce542]
MFGFEKYHGENKTIWYDDLALSAERVGCGPARRKDGSGPRSRG